MMDIDARSNRLAPGSQIRQALNRHRGCKAAQLSRGSRMVLQYFCHVAHGETARLPPLVASYLCANLGISVSLSSPPTACSGIHCLCLPYYGPEPRRTRRPPIHSHTAFTVALCMCHVSFYVKLGYLSITIHLDV
jgi:hypothetical protein